MFAHQGQTLFTNFSISFDEIQDNNATKTRQPNTFTSRYCAPEVAGYVGDIENLFFFHWGVLLLGH